MEILSSKFEISNTDVLKCPAGKRHEYAFIGRSNVGKSSLINMLTHHKGLAQTSATPGKTTLINHFLINDEWYIVDLPGYGYAQRGKKMQAQIKKIIEDYILERPQMTCLFLLVDSRHEPQKIDLEFMEWLGENGIPFAIVFTKLDKLSSAAGKVVTAKYLETLKETWEELPPVFYTSSANGRGRGELLDYIEELNRLEPIDEFADEDVDDDDADEQ
jgi:GTP-binding protein